MPRFRTFAAAALLACATAPAALAQQVIEQQMTAEEFTAAGLDKLDPAELEALNRWLRRQVQEEASVAAEQAREEVQRQARVESAGRSDGGPLGAAREPIQSALVGEFNGFGRGQRYTLANGQVWEQTDSSRLDGVRRTDPAVTVSPGALGSWYLQIDDYSTRAKVRRVN